MYELTVFGECDNLEHFSVALEDGVEYVEHYRVQHVFYDHAQDCVGTTL